MTDHTEVPATTDRPRITERPRLTRLLDGATARVRMLVAPAGYGKTTLAEQWGDVSGRRSTWYRTTPAASAVRSVTR